jgi:hypothetical protein
MKRLNPPRVPTWLLDRCGVTGRNEALTGDLIEEFREGRSHAWYWAHALLAIVMAAGADLWEHKLLAARAFLIGEVATTALSFLFGNTVYVWGPRFGMLSVGWWFYTLGTVFVLYAVSGWLVGRLHRAQRAAMVLWFAVMSCCFSIVWSFPLLSLHLVNSIDSPRFRPYLAFDLTSLAVVFIAVLVGGLSGAHDRRRSTAVMER